MKRKYIFYETLVSALTFVISWLALSFYFFPIKYATPEGSTLFTESYFWVSVHHMAAIKLLISLLFSVFALFVFEQRLEKKQKQRESEKKD